MKSYGISILQLAIILIAKITVFRKSVQNFSRMKGFLLIFDGFSLTTKGFLPKIFGTEMSMPLALHREFETQKCVNKVPSHQARTT